MKPSVVLRHAARRVERKQNVYGCTAIKMACGLSCLSDNSEVPQQVWGYFRLIGGNRGLGSPWWGLWDDSRIVALCLAAAIAESEGQ